MEKVLLLKTRSAEECRHSAPLNLQQRRLSDLSFNSQKHMKRPGKTRPDLFSALGSRLCSWLCPRSTDVCGMQTLLTAVLGVTSLESSSLHLGVLRCCLPFIVVYSKRGLFGVFF